jgi:hypothetical protein
MAPPRRPWMIKLIVVVLVLYGLYGPALQLFGSSASARISEVRRTGGTEPQLLHRYWWSIGYVFTAADGQRYSGHTRALAPDSGPQGYRPIEPVYYLAAFPAANVLARDAGPHAGTGVMLALAALLLWLTGPRAGRKARGRTRNRALIGRAKPTAQPAQLEPMTPAQTEHWMSTYRRHARIYAWGFFLLMIPLVLLLIWFEVRVIDQEVLLSLAFFVVVFFLLARWSRRDHARFPGHHSHASEILGRSGLHLVAALRSRSRCRHQPYRHLFALTRAGALEGRLCAAFAPA